MAVLPQEPHIHYAIQFVVREFSNLMSKVEYRPVNPWYGGRCSWCGNDATQEAFQNQGNLTAISRCCDDPKCMALAAEMCRTTAGAA